MVNFRKINPVNILSGFIALSLLGYPAFVFSDSSFWSLPVPLQGAMPEAHNSPALDRQSEKCAACHPLIYHQWHTSLHARAVSPGLLGQLPAFDDDTKNDCLNCHAPRTEQQQVLKNNNNAPVNGIDCSACHVRQHVRYGPKYKELTPHGQVKQLKIFQKSEFCAPCHQFGDDGILVNGKPLENTYQEWKDSPYAQKGIQCQNCHMHGTHSFKGIHDRAMTRKGLGVTISRTKKAIHLEVVNIGAGHALPTYITPRIRLRIQSADGKKQIEHIIQRRMYWSIKDGWQELSDTRLLPGQTARISLPLLPENSALAEVIVEPDADYYERVYPFLIDQLAEELDSHAVNKLKLARDCSAQSIYVLYSYECPAATQTCVKNNP